MLLWFKLDFGSMNTLKLTEQRPEESHMCRQNKKQNYI